MRARVVVLSAVSIGLMAPAFGFSQGLGDAAKRERARRAEARPGEPARVYTNDSVGGSPTKGTYSAPGGATAPLPTNPAAPGAPSAIRPAGTGSAPAAGGGESYWRGRAASARAAVASAEKRVARIEAEAARYGPYTPGQTGGACVDGAVPLNGGESAIALRERAKGSKTCDPEVLRIQNSQRLHGEVEAARGQLETARKALVGLEDEARRAGALPGWLR